MRRWLGIGGVAGGVAGLIGLLMGGCSSAAAPYPDSGSFCAAVAAAQCQAPDGGLGIPALCGVSADQCTMAAEATCFSTANAALKDPTRVYNQANAPACITATEEAYGQSSISATDLAIVTNICAQVFAGNAPIGAKCTSTASCAQSVDGGAPADGGAPTVVCSPVSPGSKDTVCAMAVPVPVLGFCANPGDVCEAGSYCSGSPAQCRPGGTGGPCSETMGCALGYYCSNDTCKVGGQQGSPCNHDSDCASSLCDTNVAPPLGSVGSGSCEVALTFAVGADDCKAFGASPM